MGCGQSNVLPADDNVELILVGGCQSISNQISHFTDIEIYSLDNKFGQRGKHRRVPLPCYTFNNGSTRMLTHSFSSAFNTDKSLVYLTGGCYGEEEIPTNHFWAVDTKTDSQIIMEARIKYGNTIPLDAIQYIRPLPEIPKPMKNHKSFFSRHQGSDYLYVVGNLDSVYRFNFTKYCWTTLPKMPMHIRQVSSVLVINHYLYVMGDDSLLVLNLASGQWIIKCEGQFPCGNAVSNGNHIFIHKYDYYYNVIYVYDCVNNILFKYMDVEESDVTQKCGMAALGRDSIYMCGGFDEELKRSTNSIIQLGIRMKRTFVAGFIPESRENHSLFIRCSRSDENP
ncbi:uncharacterized protein LOC141905790 [Tubulanus polymorphus]|uniref:uncharacterized protein LOC141905790 n=1 Tax=Tubulanus polymorphus TaxID=672921 RepID=UPI003DA5FC9E